MRIAVKWSELEKGSIWGKPPIDESKNSLKDNSLGNIGNCPPSSYRPSNANHRPCGLVSIVIGKYFSSALLGLS